MQNPYYYVHHRHHHHHHLSFKPVSHTHVWWMLLCTVAVNLGNSDSIVVWMFFYIIIFAVCLRCVITQLCNKFVGCDWIGSSPCRGSIIIWLVGKTQCRGGGSFIWWDYEMWNPCQVSHFTILILNLSLNICTMEASTIFGAFNFTMHVYDYTKHVTCILCWRILSLNRPISIY